MLYPSQSLPQPRPALSRTIAQVLSFGQITVAAQPLLILTMIQILNYRRIPVPAQLAIALTTVQKENLCLSSMVFKLI